MRFIVVLHTDDGARFGATVPDLPGCFSGGDSLDEALENVREAIDVQVEGLIEEGLAVPEQLRSLAIHQANADYADGVWALVDVPVEKYLGPVEKINITVPRLVLSRIDEYARKHGQSRSGFLVEAARSAMRPQAG